MDGVDGDESIAILIVCDHRCHFRLYQHVGAFQGAVAMCEERELVFVARGHDQLSWHTGAIGETVELIAVVWIGCAACATQPVKGVLSQCCVDVREEGVV